MLSYRDLLRFKKKDNKDLIWCKARKNWYMLAPEEVVRQSVICHLETLGYSLGHVTVEKQVIINHLRKRYDVALSDKSGDVILLVECKEPGTPIKQAALEQIGIYNSGLKGKYLWITNGHQNFVFLIDHQSRTSIPIEEVPLAPH